MNLFNTRNLSCFEQIPQSYLVCVTVHKARDLTITNADTFVAVSFNNTSNRTKIFQNSDSPFFNEYFVFETYKSLTELLKMHVHFIVYKKTCCVRKNVVVGEFSVDLNTIWEYPNHFVYKKWVGLENPSDESDQKVKGYLQIDVSIVSKFDKPAPVSCEVRDYETVEKNLLEPIRHNLSEQSVVKFAIKIYNARLVEKGQYFIKLLLGSLQAKSKILSDTQYPEWNEEFDCITLYPSSCNTLLVQLYKVELCSSFIWSQYEINFANMTNDVSPYPSFGPTYIHFYDFHSSRKYIGRLLLWIESERFSEQNQIARYNVRCQQLPRLPDHDYWTNEIFQLYLYIFELNCIATRKKCIKVKFMCGESTSTEIELNALPQDDNPERKFCKIPFNAIPLLVGSIFYPDNRLKFESDVMIERTLNALKKELDLYRLARRKGFQNVKHERRYLKLIFSSFLNSLKQIQVNLYFKIFKEVTTWDRNHMNYKISVVESILKEMGNLKTEIDKRKRDGKNLKIIHEKLELFYLKLRILNVFNIQDKWPDIFIILSIGNLDVAYYRTNPKNYLFHQNTNCYGMLSKIPHSIIFRPVSCTHSCENCGCVFAHSHISLWIGTEAETFNSVPEGLTNSADSQCLAANPLHFTCNIYIHQAKIRHLENHQVICNGQIIFFVNNLNISTRIINDSLSPVWNETLTINQVSFVGNPYVLRKHPPWVILKFLNVNEKKNSYSTMGSSYASPAVKILENNTVLQKFVENEINGPVTDGGSEDPTHVIDKSGNHSPRKRKAAGLHDLFRRHKHDVNIDLIDVFPPPLQWVPIFMNGNQTGEVLISIELIQNSSPIRDDEIGKFQRDDLPSEIRPIMIRYKLEIIMYGLRNAFNLTRQTIGRYRIQATIGELVLETGFSGAKYGHAINFLDPYVIGMVFLPEQFVYWPPLILKHVECVKHETVMSVALLPNPEFFFVEENIHGKKHEPYVSDNETEYDFERADLNKPLLKKSDEEKPQERKLFKNFHIFSGEWFATKTKKKTKAENTVEDFEKRYTWWTKFYNSIDKSANKHQLVIFTTELENQPEYSYLTDWATPVPMTRNDVSNKSANQQIFSTLKCKIQVTKVQTSQTFPVTNTLSKLFLSKYNDIVMETPVVLRIYIVQALNLRSHDVFDLSDPYIKIEYGKIVVSDRSHYQENQTNPIFGRKFEVCGNLPKDQYLKVSIIDHDTTSKDDLIGTTIIDIEDRLRTRHRAYCGIPKEYSKTGYNSWRDVSRPSEILIQICDCYNLGTPKFVGKRIQVADITFEDETVLAQNEELEERLSLTVLNNLDKIPDVGFNLIPEHVETRSLFRVDRPGLEQGKLQMWVDIFSPDRIPPPIDIAPEPARVYELRAIVWNTKDVILNDTNIFGKNMSDIYVKAWLENIDDALFTDVHYRSMNGEGNFNWRMNFRFKYLMAEEMMLITQPKGMFEKFDTLIRTPPTLHVQVWDSDAVSADDFLGSLTINLNHFASPFPTADKCKLEKHKKIEHHEYDNLFLRNKIRGWFPFQGYKEKVIGQTGKVDLELEIFPEDQADINPAGLGRDGPHALPPPKRPDTSFSWFSNPFKSLKYILWPQIRRMCIYCCIVLVILLIIGGSVAHFVFL